MPQIIVNGLLIGGVYAMIAVGMTIIFGVMKIVNFAQGEFLMIGMYATLVFYPLLGGKATPYPLIPLVILVMIIIGYAVFHSTIKFVIGKGDTNYIVLTLGISYFLQNIVQMIFGSNFYSLQVSDELKYGVYEFRGVVFSMPRLIAFFVAVIVVGIINYFLTRTDLGRAMRATSENNTIATILGIDVKRIYALAFILGVLFAGLSGLLLTPMFSIYPRAGVLFSSITMTIIVLGGLGNVKGAMVGGLLIGLVESFVSVYVNLEMAPVAIAATLLLVLMIKPTGIFGKGARTA